MYAFQASEPDSRPPPVILFPPERAADLGTGCADIHVGDTTVAAHCRQKRFRVLQAIGEDRRRQAMRRGILLL